ncbi:MAG: hypothetical protein ACX933_18325, partial [Marinobacter adhaerens]
MFKGGAIFTDHATGFTHIELLTTLSSHATLEAKLNYEASCRDNGVIVQSYLSDNGTAFTADEYTKHLRDFRQISRFAGVGAHHHNGVVEQSIRTIMSIARTMLLHASLHWPDAITPVLWPQAVMHAIFLFNRVPEPSTGLSRIDIFTKTRWSQRRFHDLHVWGSPTYVLDKTISDGKKIPRWKPRSNRCVYLGMSASHASTVPLVLNPATGSITPQFHCVFDDWFTTIATSVDDLPDYNSPEWLEMFGDSEYQYLF